jgi:hypothetical protein
MAQYSKVGPVPLSYLCNECYDHGLVHCAIKWHRGENLNSHED